MRVLVIILTLAALAACGETRLPLASQRAAPPTMGQYVAASQTARALTGNVAIERDRLVFARGQIIYTSLLDDCIGADRMAREGQTYAAAALAPADLAIELRRVNEEVAPNGMGRGAGLCGDGSATYVALAYGKRATTVTVLVFSGAEAPGPRATNSRLCAAYGYAAPEGARTRQGVVL